MGRTYIRLFSDVVEALADVSDGEFRTLMVANLRAHKHASEGRYASRELLCALLPRPMRRHVTTLIRRGHLVELTSGEVYIDGRVEAQEGDLTVKDRVARWRARDRVTPPPVSNVTPPPVSNVTPSPVTSLLSRSKEQKQRAESRGTRHLSNLYRAYEELTGKPPSDKERGWIDDLCKQFSREGEVGPAMYADPHPRSGSLLGRVTNQLRGAV